LASRPTGPTQPAAAPQGDHGTVRGKNKQWSPQGIAAVLVVILCVAWLTYYFTSSPSQHAPEPAEQVADTVAARLHEHPEFANVSVFHEPDNPKQLRITGAVDAAEHLTKLEAVLKEIRPEGGYVNEVQVLAGG
jgi:hypothetical protein